jgi:hypothetical protein
MYIKKPPYSAVTVIGERASVSEVYAKILLMGNSVKKPKRYKAIAVKSCDYKAIRI